MCLDASARAQGFRKRTCPDSPIVYALLQDFVDGRLSVENMEMVQDHYPTCAICTARFEELRELKGGL